MAGMMKVVLPVAATAAALFLAPETGGLSLFGAGAADSAMAGADVAAGASTMAEAAAADETASFATSALGNSALGTSWLGSTIASVSPYVKGAAVAAQVGGTVTTALGENAQARAAKQQANFESQQLENNANNAMGAAEIRMEEQNRETAYVLSNAAAAAAAGGGSVTDPTVNTNLKTIAGEGRFRALTDMYQGEASAQADRTQSAAVRYGGQQQASADRTKMYSTILGGGSSLFDKYASVSDNSNNSSTPPWAIQAWANAGQ